MFTVETTGGSQSGDRARRQTRQEISRSASSGTPQAARAQPGATRQGIGLSGKFIGEVERGEKSISIDSLYRVSVALEVPLRELTDVGDKNSSVPTEEAERIFALVSGRRRPETSAKPTTSSARCSAAPPKIFPATGSAGAPARFHDGPLR